MNPTPQPGHLFFFGLGYTAQRMAERLLPEGWKISGTARTPEKCAELAALGFKVHLFDGIAPLADPAAAFTGVTHIVNSISPPPEGDPALALHREDLIAATDLRWIGYLSTPAVYGDRQGEWVCEEDPINPGSPRGQRRADAERGWLDGFADTDKAVQVFRLSGIYGPGRNELVKLGAGTARIIDKPGQVFNRIHVDDIATILLASMARPRADAVYNVADDEACASGDVVRHASGLLGIDPPTPIPFDSAALSPMARSFYSECKRLDTAKLRNELGVNLAYPTYREGLAEISAEL
jgi:nucleoside-diphosphate-sugar epimerase